MNTDLTPETLAELRRLHGLATPGMWSATSGIRWGYRVTCPGRDVADTGAHADAHLIAAAVNALPALLDAAAKRDALRSLADASIQSDIEARMELDALRAERDALAAKVERVRALHRPIDIDALASWDCVNDQCDCEDEHRTEKVRVCGHCYEIGEQASRYAYEYGGLPLWPCPTIRALDGEADR